MFTNSLQGVTFEFPLLAWLLALSLLPFLINLVDEMTYMSQFLM